MTTNKIFHIATRIAIKICLITELIFLISCNDSEPEIPDCGVNPEEKFIDCDSYSYSIIDAETHKNLIGNTKGLYDPDSLKIYFDQTLYKYEFNIDSINETDWWYFSFNFSRPLDECTFIFQDTSFTMRYYIELSSLDTDTLDIYITPCYDGFMMSYNGNFNVDRPTTNIPPQQSSFYLRKE